MEYKIVIYDQFDEIDFEPNLVVGFYQDIRESTFRSQYEKIKSRFPGVECVACSTESNIYNDAPFVDIDEEHNCVFLFLALEKGAYDVQIVGRDERFESGKMGSVTTPSC
jgi:hypothetical protein